MEEEKTCGPAKHALAGQVERPLAWPGRTTEEQAGIEKVQYAVSRRSLSPWSLFTTWGALTS